MAENSTRKQGRPRHKVEMGELNTTVPAATLQQMRSLVEQRGMTITAFVRQAIEEKLKREGA